MSEYGTIWCILNFIQRFYHQVFCGWLGVSWEQAEYIWDFVEKSEGISSISRGK